MSRKALCYLFLPFLLLFPLSCATWFLEKTPSKISKRAFPQRKFASLDLKSQISQMDPQKPTLCSMTLNSSDEQRIFNEYLGKDFNSVELVEEGNSKWFQKACESGIKCDILLISGHFGGSFFGSSGEWLPSEVLENASCRTSCSGLLKHPREVFLFGCNTTAGKEPDSRTPEQYADILYNEHRDVYTSRAMAEMHAAFRYSPLGSQTQDRMKRVFQNARIYGFHSTAPSGPNIRPRLHRYFRSIPDKNYLSHLNQFPMDEENTLWSKAMRGQYIRSVNGSPDLENPACILGSNEPIYKKLSWIDRVFKNKDEILAYAPNINEYLSSLEKRFGENTDHWPKEEVSYIERLQFNKEAKGIVGKFLSQPIQGILSVQFKLLGLGKKVGWYNRKEEKKIQLDLLNMTLSKNLEREEKDLICFTEYSGRFEFRRSA